MPLPIDPSMAVSGTEWQVPGISGVGSDVPGAGAATGAPQESFGQMLSNQVQGLQGLQTDAAQQSQALASGQATDPTAVVMAVERAQLSMQLAGQIRTKAVEAANEIFHTSV